MADNRKICVGLIMGAHGVRGLVKLRSFTEQPADVIAYGQPVDESGERQFSITLKSSTNDHFVAEIAGIGSKEAADALRGVKLYVPRTALPKTGKREYYDADLVGLTVVDAARKILGSIKSVHDYGGGPFLDIALQGFSDAKGKPVKEVMLPFNDDCVPEIDLKAGHVVAVMPDGWLDQSESSVT